MFERFIILAKARRAVQAGRWEEALDLTKGPRVRNDRRAEDVRAEAVDGLLARARQRFDAGELSSARQDLDRLLTQSEQHDSARDLLARVNARACEVQTTGAAQREQHDRARKLAEQGELDAATELVRTGGASMPAALAALIDGRRQLAGKHLQEAATLLEQDRIDGAVAEFRRAVPLDRKQSESWQMRKRLLAAGAKTLGEVVDARLAEGDVAGAARAWHDAGRDLPGVHDCEPAPRAGARLGNALRAHLQSAAERALGSENGADRTSLASAVRLVLVGSAGCPANVDEELQGLAACVEQTALLRDRGPSLELADGLHELARQLPSRLLATAAAASRQAAAATERSLQEARNLASDGDLTQARQVLVGIVEEWPMHEPARKELELIDQGARDREQRLAAARKASREGRLQQACAEALALAVPGAAGDEARLVVKEVRARMELVRKGLDQVKASLHGRDGGGPEGVRHCLRRLEELTKVQVDHPEVAALSAALHAELECFDTAERVRGQAAAGALAGAGKGLQELVAGRAALWGPERFDARLQALGDALLHGAEQALAAGLLDDLDGVIAAVEMLDPVVGSRFAERGAKLREQAAARRRQAEEHAAAAKTSLAARDLDTAEERIGEALQCWRTVPLGRRLFEEITAVRGQQQALDRIEALAAEQDFAGAHHKLADLPPTPALLRTRIFDLKLELARAQGLDGPFLLRVDEGGEYLVLRGESVTIGNVRDSSTDLPVLANVAGRHARIERSMSFHGGMTDTVVAQEGEVLVNGTRTASQRLRPGDRVQLGRSLSFQYGQPCGRSLTSAMTLGGGFQAGGTERILLLKDRGRDGRIVIGPGDDVHVRVPGATGELEVFAHKTGQMRVRCPGQGLLDGRPFTGEHPVIPGAVVQGAGITLVLLPWHRGR